MSLSEEIRVMPQMQDPAPLLPHAITSDNYYADKEANLNEEHDEPLDPIMQRRESHTGASILSFKQKPAQRYSHENESTEEYPESENTHPLFSFVLKNKSELIAYFESIEKLDVEFGIERVGTDALNNKLGKIDHGMRKRIGGSNKFVVTEIVYANQKYCIQFFPIMHEPPPRQGEYIERLRKLTPILAVA